MVSGGQSLFIAVLVLQFRLALDQNHPLILILVVPLPRRRRLATRDDPFDLHALGGNEIVEDLFLRQRFW